MLLMQGLYEDSIRYYVRVVVMNPKADNAWQYLRISLRYVLYAHCSYMWTSMLVLLTNHMLFHFKPAMRHELTWLLHAMPATSMLFRKSFLSESQSWTSAVEQILIQQGSRKLARRMLSLAALMEMEFGIQEPFVLLILVWCMLILLFNKLGVYSGEQHPIVDVKYHGKRQWWQRGEHL